jgi:3'-phosphoadenosine 5'-phosphosulfate sulfotransferase (PAPS reductase)/FAD synthetase
MTGRLKEGSVKHIVGFSGGIDSQACARWVLNRFPVEDVILLNSNAGGNEHPMTVGFIANYSEKVHPVVIVQPLVRDIWETPGFAEKRGMNGDDELTFDKLAAIKGRFPYRKAQFCTEALKLRPTKRWLAENLPDGEYVRYSGVRRDESGARSKRKFVEFDEWFDCDLCNPVYDWTKQMCFDYVKAHEEPINALYALGFERVGCAPCVNSGKEDIRRWADRFPEMIDKVRVWEKSTGKTFFPPVLPAKEKHGYNWIDEVVEWARTDRGGYQFNILHGLERPSCESKFGLCE